MDVFTEKIVIFNINLSHNSLWEHRIKTLWESCFFKSNFFKKKLDVLTFIQTILELTSDLSKLEKSTIWRHVCKARPKTFWGWESEFCCGSCIVALDCKLTRLRLIATPAAFLHSCFLHHLLFILDVTQLLDMLCLQKAETTSIKTRTMNFGEDLSFALSLQFNLESYREWKPNKMHLTWKVSFE